MVVSSFSQCTAASRKEGETKERYMTEILEKKLLVKEVQHNSGFTEISLKRKKKKKIHRLYEMLAALERASTSSWVYECVPFSSFLSLSLPDLPTRYITIGRSSSSSIKFHAEEHLKVSFFVLLF
jgi:hypothetical protein